MRAFLPLMLCVVTVASCASKPVRIAADRCWSVSLGDKVEGTAVLSAYKARFGCTECGASVAARDCPGMGFAIGSGSADQAYHRILRTAPANGNGYVQQVVFLSGKVVPNGAPGRLMIRAEQLRLAH